MALTEEQRTQTVNRGGDMVYRLALARTANVSDAEDVFQEVFLRYFRHEDKFQTDEHRKAWLLRCTVNRCKSVTASPWRKRIVPLETAAEIGVEDDYREVYSAVLSLPAKYRAVIHLHYFEGLSVAEIAAALESTEGTVKSQLPKFDVSSNLDLIGGLKALGVTDVFDSAVSDFTPLGVDTSLFVDKAQHAARVMIDEEGCTAASYVILGPSADARPPDDIVDFTLDRPFLFAITGYGNLPLYLGIVNQPNG